MVTKLKWLVVVCSLIFGASFTQAQNALHFDGINDEVNCGNDASLDITGTTITLEALVNLDADTQNDPLFVSNVISKATTGSSGFGLRAGGSNLQVGFALGNGIGFTDFNSPNNVLSLNTWHHVAATYDGSMVRLYVDGVEVSAQAATAAMSSTGTADLLLGNDPAFGPRHYHGAIDEVRIWNVTRTAAQIDAFKDTELCSTTGLVSVYDFESGMAGADNTGVTALLDGAGSNDGTLNGFALMGMTSNWITGLTLNAAPTNTSATDTQTSCGPFTWIDGNTYMMDNNTATFTIPNAAGCDSLITLDLTVSSVDASTTSMGNTITASMAGATYQWIDCNNGSMPIMGETSQAFTATMSGDYAVIVTNGPCVDTSACVNIAFVPMGPENALNFDGVDDEVDCGNDASLDITGTNFTLEAWVNLDVFTAAAFQSTIMSKNLPNNAGFIFRAGGTGQIELAIGDGNFYNNFTSPNNVITVNTWHHVAASYDGVAVRLYVDGTEVSSTPFSNPMVSAAANNLWIGNDNTFSPRYLPGSIDNVRIWNITRTANQINTFRNAQLCDMTGLVAAYDFEVGTADGNNMGETTLPDLANSNDGTLMNFALTGTSSNWVDGQMLGAAPAATMGTDVQSSCGPFTWIDGMTYTMDNNTATFTLMNAAGCDSIVTLDLTIGNLDVSTSVAGNAITANQAGATYQWLDCNNGSMPIMGETGQTFVASMTGDYAVVIMDGPCTDTSACVNITFPMGGPENALNFNGINNEVNCGNDPSLDITGTNITLEAWVNLDVFTANAFQSTIMSKNLPNNAGFIFRAGGNGQIELALGDGGFYNNFASVDNVISVNTWHHVAATYDGANVRMYVDGVEVFSQAYTAPMVSAAANNLWIGNDNTFSPRFFPGSIDNVRLWNVTRTANEISTFMASELCDMTGLVAAYDFNVGFANGTNTMETTLPDLAGSNNGTLMNFTLTGTASNWVDGQVVGAAPAATMGTDVQAACGSFTWIDGMTYTSDNNTATFTIQNALGCDSIVTLDLTITNNTTGTDVQTACGSFTWIDGMTYTSDNNTATFTINNPNGCDSVVTLDLTIAQPTSATDVQSACDSYTWIDGNTYTANNNTATFTMMNAAGCDSVITLDLTITNSTSSTDVQSACDSYTWIDGNTYTASNNTATFTMMNAVGCDSVITLDLTINNSTSSTDVQTACGSFTWIDGNTYTADNNTATFTMMNAAGCDSVITLDLTIGTATASTDVQSACGSFTWIDGNTYTADNNSATFTMMNAAGCDSVITLDLTINNVDVTTSVNMATITANATGATYQWIDCDNANSPIAGETNQSFTATANGNYAVIVTENGCTDTSACVNVTGIGLEEYNQIPDLVVYPNPSQNNTFVELGNTGLTRVTITSMTGQTMFAADFSGSTKYELPVQALSPAIYFITVENNNLRSVVKLMKQ